MIYSSLRSSHSTVDLCPFKGRSGSSGTANQPVFVSKDQLSVGADIQHQRDILLKIRPERKDTAHGICPYKAGDNRKEDQLSLRVDMNVKISGLFPDQSLLGRLIRSPYQRFHRILEENMVHTGVAHKAQEIDIFPLDRGCSGKLADKLISGAVNTVCQFFVSMFQHIVGSGNHISPIGRLGIKTAGGTQFFSCPAVQKIGCNGGGTDIKGSHVIMVFVRNFGKRRMKRYLPDAGRSQDPMIFGTVFCIHQKFFIYFCLTGFYFSPV